MKINSFVLDPGSQSSTPPASGGGGGTNHAGGPQAAPPSSPSTPQTFTPPPGQRLVADSDYGRYESAYKTLSGLGFDKPDELTNYKPFFEAMRSRKDLDPATLANMLVGRKEQPKSEGQPAPLDQERLKADLLAELRAESAWKAHSERRSKLPDSVKAKIVEMLGGEDEDLTPLLLESAMYRLEENRIKHYASNQDVLAGKVPGEYTDDLLNQTLSTYPDLVKKLKGKTLAAIGKAATAARSSTVAGNAGSQGKPGGADDGSKPLHKQERATKLARVEAALAAAQSRGQ